MRVFLSFNAKDAPTANALRSALLRLEPESEVFFAPISSLGQGFWLPKLEQQIEAADAFLLLLGPLGVGPWQAVEYHAAFSKHVREPSFVLAPVIFGNGLAPGLPFLRQLNWVEIPAAFDDEVTHRVLRALKDGPGPTVSPLWKLVQPYRGLEAMTEANADYFYGRDKETAAVLTLLAEKPGRLPVLVGASGVGKSSIAQAGVLSALKAMQWPRRGEDTASRARPWPDAFQDSRSGWAWLIMRPGDDPLERLASSFTQLWFDDPLDPKRGPLAREWAEGLRSRNTLSDLIEASQARLEQNQGARPKRFLLYLDQGEELYTGAARTAPKDARRFSDLLAEGLRDPRLLAFASLRADYFDRFQADASLFAVHEQVNAPPLTKEALRQVVAGPPQRLEVRFEDDRLPDRIVEAAAGKPGALPLLSYLLTDMWSAMTKRADGVLRLPSEAIDLGGVLAATAEKFLKSAPTMEPALKRLLTLKLALVPPEGAPLRRQARRSECSEQEWSLVERLSDYPWRLVVTGERDVEENPSEKEVTAEIAHEALLMAWPKLAGWLQDEREFLVFKGEAERDERRWHNMGRPDKALLRALDLDRAIAWAGKRAEDFSARVAAFIHASIAFDHTEKVKQLRFRTYVSVGAVAASMIIAGLGYGYFGKWREAERQKNLAQAALWIANARAELRDHRVEPALGYAFKAFEAHPDEASRSALISALLELSPHLRRMFTLGPGATEAIAWVGAGAVLVARGQDGGELQSFSAAAPASPGAGTRWPVPSRMRADDGNRAPVRALQVIDQNRALAALGDGAVALVTRGEASASTWVPSKTVTPYPNASAVSISRSGALIAMASVDSDALLVKCATPSDPKAAPDCAPVSIPKLRARAVAVSPDESRIAIADEAGALYIYDAKGTRLRGPIKIGGAVVAIGWAKTRDLIAIGDAAGNVTVIDPAGADGAAPAKASFAGAAITTLDWSAQGLTLAFSCEGKKICVWPVAVGQAGAASFAPIRQFAGHADTVTRLVWSPEGDSLASASVDGTLRLWGLSQDGAAGVALYAAQPAQLLQVATSVDGRQIAAGAADGALMIWDAASGALLRTHSSPIRAEVASLAWSRSGTLASALDNHGFTVLPAEAGAPARAIKFDVGLDPRIVFLKDGTTLATPQPAAGLVALVDSLGSDPDAGKYLEPIGPGKEPWGLALDISGDRLFVNYTSPNGESEVDAWDMTATEPKPLGPMPKANHEKRDADAGKSLSVSSNGRWLATSGGDDFVRVYDIKQNKSRPSLALDPNSGGSHTVAYSPDSKKLAALDAGGQVYIWTIDESSAERFAVFSGMPKERSGTADDVQGALKATWLAWVNNESLALASGTSSINVIGLNPGKWRSRIETLGLQLAF